MSRRWIKVSRPWRIFLFFVLVYFRCTKGNHSHSLGLDWWVYPMSMEYEIVRVVSLSTMEVSEITRYLIDCMIFIFKSIPVISQRPVHLSMLGVLLISALHNVLSKPLAAFTQPLSKQWTAVREEWILSQWLSSVLEMNIGRAGDRASDLLFSSPQSYRLIYGALQHYTKFGLRGPNTLIYFLLEHASYFSISSSLIKFKRSSNLCFTLLTDQWWGIGIVELYIYTQPTHIEGSTVLQEVIWEILPRYGGLDSILLDAEMDGNQRPFS